MGGLVGSEVAAHMCRYVRLVGREANHGIEAANLNLVGHWEYQGVDP